MSGLKVVELVVFVALFAAVAVIGFAAARWRRGATMDHLDEWGLGGRSFGGWITWFLLGGDLYTAYTFVAIPALVYASGAIGFYALPYTIIVFPLVMLPLARLWSVSRVHGYVTPADYVRHRHDSPTLALLVAVTGIVATMPYIALQLVGLEAVLRTLGLNGRGLLGHLPIAVAFVVLALYTYSSGLRAPALIAFVKDLLVYVVIIVAVVYLPSRLGGFGAVFDDARRALATPGANGRPRGSVLLSGTNQLQYATLAFGSALALFLYPHSLTGVLASRSRNTVKRNMAALPAYSLLLGLLALLGFVALATGAKPIVNNATGRPDTNTIVPVLFDAQFPDWFAGIAFAAIGIGALVPAAIMSIAAANLWTRNVYKEFLHRSATPAQEARQARVASLVVKFGALGFVVFVDPQFSVDLQLIGGVIVLQTLPAVAIALYTRWFHRAGLVLGWAAGMAYGLALLYGIPNPANGKAHFGGSALALGKLSVAGWHPFGTSPTTVYVGFVALLVNLVVAVAASAVLRALRVPAGTDATRGADYLVEVGDPAVPPPGTPSTARL